MLHTCPQYYQGAQSAYNPLQGRDIFSCIVWSVSFHLTYKWRLHMCREVPPVKDSLTEVQIPHCKCVC